MRHHIILKAHQGVTAVTNQDVHIVEQSDALDAPLIDVPNGDTTIDEIIMTGNGVMNDYPKDPEATEHAFRGGWFHTGDLGIIHPDSYIRLLDRARDIIVSGGGNISTVEVEQVVVSYPNVSDCTVTGMSDDGQDERPCAYVVLRPEARCQDTAEGVAKHDKNVAGVVIVHCRAHIIGYKTSHDVVVTDELPRTSTGKVRKNELRSLTWANEKACIKG